MIKRRSGERGAVMVLAAASFTILLLFAGMALDVGRAHLLKAQVQTAIDAAALAGALQVIPMVQISVDRWRAEHDTCVDPVTGLPYSCLTWEETSPVVLSGTEEDLIQHGRWLAIAGPKCTWPYRCAPHYQILREWLILPGNTTPVARDTFYTNATWPGGTAGARITGLSIHVDQSKVEVTATASMEVPTFFLRLIGVRELAFARTGSAVPVRR